MDFFYFISKNCDECGEEYFRPKGKKGISHAQWESRRFCSITCRNGHANKKSNKARFLDGHRGKNQNQKGEENSRAKLTEKDVLKIRSDPRSSYKIAEEFNLSDSYVRKIKRRERWGHI